MNSLILVTILAVAIHCACAERGRDRGDDQDGGYIGGDSSSEENDDCVNTCRQGIFKWNNPCRKITGTQLKGCDNKNKYINCTNTVCTEQICAYPKVWNSTSGSCVGCPNNYQISASNSSCVCAQGFTRSNKGGCVACPLNASVSQYACPCTAGSAVNYLSSPPACQACPVNSTLSGQKCVCNGSLFWNAVDWQCQPCPGTLSGWFKTTCVCNSGYIFNKTNVSCIACPLLKSEPWENTCTCGRGQRYDLRTNTCQCVDRFKCGSTSSSTVSTTTVTGSTTAGPISTTASAAATGSSSTANAASTATTSATSATTTTTTAASATTTTAASTIASGSSTTVATAANPNP